MNNIQSYKQFLNEGWFTHYEDDDIADEMIKKLDGVADRKYYKFDYKDGKTEHKYEYIQRVKTEIDPYEEENWDEKKDKSFLIRIINQGDRNYTLELKPKFKLEYLKLDVSQKKIKKLLNIIRKPYEDHMVKVRLDVEKRQAEIAKREIEREILKKKALKNELRNILK